MPFWNWPSAIGLVVIEDACQAHGAEYFLAKAQSLDESRIDGTRRGLQLLSRKESGRVRRRRARLTTNDAGIAKHMKMIRDHGQATKYYHDIEGYNGRLDAIQAGLLQAEAGVILAKWNAQRRERAAEYDRLLGICRRPRVVLPYEPSWSKAVYHLYVVRAADREGTDGTSEEGGHRHRNSLSDPAAPAESLRRNELP